MKVKKKGYAVVEKEGPDLMHRFWKRKGTVLIFCVSISCNSVARSQVESHLRWGSSATLMKSAAHFIGQTFTWAINGGERSGVAPASCAGAIKRSRASDARQVRLRSCKLLRSRQVMLENGNLYCRA